VSTQNKLSGLYTKEETKANPIAIVPLRITGIPRAFPNGQTSLPIIIAVHPGTHHITTILNIIRQMHHDGCKIQPYPWTLAAQGPPIMDEVEGEALGEEEANTANTIINPPIASKTTPQIQETRQMPVSNADK